MRPIILTPCEDRGWRWWKTREGEILAVFWMSDNHLMNSIKYVAKNAIYLEHGGIGRMMHTMPVELERPDILDLIDEVKRRGIGHHLDRRLAWGLGEELYKEFCEDVQNMQRHRHSSGASADISSIENFKRGLVKDMQGRLPSLSKEVKPHSHLRYRPSDDLGKLNLSWNSTRLVVLVHTSTYD